MGVSVTVFKRIRYSADDHNDRDAKGRHPTAQPLGTTGPGRVSCDFGGRSDIQ